MLIHIPARELSLDQVHKHQNHSLKRKRHCRCFPFGLSIVCWGGTVDCLTRLNGRYYVARSHGLNGNRSLWHFMLKQLLDLDTDLWFIIGKLDRSIEYGKEVLLAYLATGMLFLWPKHVITVIAMDALCLGDVAIASNFLFTIDTAKNIIIFHVDFCNVIYESVLLCCFHRPTLFIMDK